MKVYIAGPPLFEGREVVLKNKIVYLMAESQLRAAGFEPSDLVCWANGEWRWTEFDLLTWEIFDIAIDSCDAVLLLKGWEGSTTSLRAKSYAKINGLPVCESVEELEANLKRGD